MANFFFATTKTTKFFFKNCWISCFLFYELLNLNKNYYLSKILEICSWQLHSKKLEQMRMDARKPAEPLRSWPTSFSKLQKQHNFYFKNWWILCCLCYDLPSLKNNSGLQSLQQYVVGNFTQKIGGKAFGCQEENSGVEKLTNFFFETTKTTQLWFQ